MHRSSHRLIVSNPHSETALQPRRRQCVSGGIGNDGSSDSDSKSSDGEAEGLGLRAKSMSEMNLHDGLNVIVRADTGFGVVTSVFCSEVSAGVCTVECSPIVHGGIDRNSSNVRTRALQHRQPLSEVNNDCYSARTEKMSP